MAIELRTTVQPLWRDATSAHFAQPNGIYHAPTAPLTPPPEPGPWELHSIQQLQLFGEPKLLVVWQRHTGHNESCICDYCKARRSPAGPESSTVPVYGAPPEPRECSSCQGSGCRMCRGTP